MLAEKISSERPVTVSFGFKTALQLLYRDKFAFVSAIVIFLLVLIAVFGPLLLPSSAMGMNLRLRLARPFVLDNGWLFYLGADTLGRSMIGRMILGSQNTLYVATAAVLCSLVAGSVLGMIAGLSRGLLASVIMRLTDIVMSFPSLLMAIIILYILRPNVTNVVAILAITRIPIYLRTVRAEVLEIRERLFVTAAKALGASYLRIITFHILPVVVPTLVTIAMLDFAAVMLAESSLSFLGLGIQPPDVSWGLMVSEGRNYLINAWWLSFLPGLMIMMTTIALNLVSNWVRIVMDPKQRWRLEHSTVAKNGVTDGA